MKFTTTVEADLTVRQLAELFCGLNDDQQARFFVECAEISNGWERSSFSQWWEVGNHLRKCECSTEEARDLVRHILSGMESSQ